MPKTTLFIAKMDCPNEEKLIRSQLNALAGVDTLEFNLIQKELIISHSIEISAIQKILKNIGMDANIKDDSFTQNNLNLLQTNVKYKDWIVLGISGVLAISSEIFSYLTQVENSYLVVSLALASILISGRDVVIKGLRAIRYFTLNMNFLMTIAIIGAALIGEWPEAAMVTVLFALAEMIESYSLDKARYAIRQLMEITPEVASVKNAEGGWSEMPISKVQLNDILLVKPGERIALDGTLVRGNSSINQAPITGESLPVEKQVGDKVFAGSINERGSFEFKVTTHINDTLVAKIIRAVQLAQSERAPTQRFVDQFAKYYTPLMVVLALLVAICPPLLLNQPFYPWLYKALILLVIACPCALVISTPVTIVSGLAAAAKLGILIKGGTYLERGHQLKAVALDKTGTLTHGKPLVTDISLTAELSENKILLIAASFESHSEHPMAEAVIQKWKQLNAQESLLSVTHFEAIPGRGLTGSIQNVQYFLGNHKLAEEKGVCGPHIESVLGQLEKQGKTTIVLGTESNVLAILAVTDTIRETSIEALQDLHKLGIKTIMITGDNPTTAGIIAQSVGIDEVKASLLPQDKLSAIDLLLIKYGYVGMVGDGINDAPALAKASIGFAMGNTGTDVALETADIALMEDNLNKLPLFIRLSRSTWKKLVQNITLSIGIKAVFLVLALLGMASLWMAIFADMGASLIVVMNGLSLLRFEKPMS